MLREIILKKYEPVSDNLISILHDLQDHSPQNCLDLEDLEDVSRYLNLTRAEVFGVVQYYSMFSLKPRGKHIIRLCVSPVCRLMGSTDMLEQLKDLLHIDIGQTTPDALFTLEHTECLGQCDSSPVLMLDQEVHGNLTPQKLTDLIQSVRESEPEGV